VDLKVKIVDPPRVVTKYANGVDTMSATLNGHLLTMGTCRYVKVYFGWDTISHAGNPDGYRYWTHAEIKGWPGKFRYRLFGLRPGTRYFFRAMTRSDGISYGDELSFVTKPVRNGWKNAWINRWANWWAAFFHRGK
jgi:hypothetical protein